MVEQKKRKKGIQRTKHRGPRITYYYEVTYPVRKMRRIWKDTKKVSDLRKWADQYKTPTGVSGASALVRLCKELKIAI